MKFEIKNGMKDSELYGLLDGNISGETTDMVKQFLRPRNAPSHERPSPLHITIYANDRYAIIRKNDNQTDRGGIYLTGINDEGTYFVHQFPEEVLTEIEKSFSNKETSVESDIINKVVEQINFHQDGFQRIQGDVLVKYIHKDLIHNESNEFNQFHGNNLNTMARLQGYGTSKYPAEFVIKEYQCSYLHAHNVNKIFGNHKIKVHGGKLYWIFGQGNESYCALGKSFTLKHNEHKKVNIDIPKDHIAIIMPQLKSDTQKVYD